MELVHTDLVPLGLWEMPVGARGAQEDLVLEGSRVWSGGVRVRRAGRAGDGGIETSVPGGHGHAIRCTAHGTDLKTRGHVPAAEVGGLRPDGGS